MKRKILTLTALLMLFGISASAEQVGDVVGKVYPTEIVTTVCDMSIPAYNLNGETAVLVSDLSNYGFDVQFDNAIVNADYNWQKEKTPIDTAAKTHINVLYTDIIVKLNGIEVPAYNIDGSMAIPIERTCETYTAVNKDNEVSDFSLNYIWNGIDKKLSLDISENRVSYQDFMIDLIKAAHMDFGSAFYNNYVFYEEEGKEAEKTAEYASKFTDIAGTELEKYIFLLHQADLLNAKEYEYGSQLRPYRGVTKTDAAYLISQMVGNGVKSADFFEGFDFQFYKKHYSDMKDKCEYDNFLIDYGEIPSDDNYIIPDWVKPYFAYLNTIGILTPDENNCINPNQFLTREKEQQLITAMLEYMERDITNIEINIKEKHNEEIHHLLTPAKIVNRILYVPMGSLFNSSYNGVGYSKYANASHGRNYYCYSGGTGVYYNIMPGISGCVKEFFSQGMGCSNVPYVTDAEYPVLKLYGEPLIPVYNYNTHESLTNIIDGLFFDETTNTINFEYICRYFNGS